MNPTKRVPKPRVLIAEDDLQRRVSELAQEIDRDYADTDRLVAIGFEIRSEFRYGVDLRLLLKMIERRPYRMVSNDGTTGTLK